jgi:hypothetical protein
MRTTNSEWADAAFNPWMPARGYEGALSNTVTMDTAAHAALRFFFLAS